MAEQVILYSAKLCGDCQSLKAFMDANDIGYESRDIQENPEYARDVEVHTGKLGVPYLIIGGQWVCGYDPEHPFSEAFARGLFGL